MGTGSPSETPGMPTLESCLQNCEKIDVHCFEWPGLWCVIVVGYTLENLIQL